ncbi:uncharacterized protein PITG_08606 [Phytophthora infestans T30-4]|uniref:SWIM-type domain-containing protein n=1 Tax=Phytophthora infestans (strain T30-4) TaxID=403677 RepID=D0NB14_PHYIT|nr:uncharacterized protein PITG_08606 [Phytophthora infestans T30-4]EEY55022.1 conserved hypothetical protein [Phytophthora infestans T30-4]|eukprot:XP_002903967.1 conserved hypothetical protein [Phytophthora infestans T30-4]
MSIVVFTGTLCQPRKEATAEAEQYGYVVGARLTKTSSFLICGAKVGAKKMEEAEKLGVATLTELEWREKLAATGSVDACSGSEAEVKGFRVQPRMTKATTFLVCGDKAGQKLKEAEKLGVTVLTEEPSKKRTVAYDEVTGAVNGIKPKQLLVDGTFHDVKSASGSTYIVKRIGMVYSCSCPAWRNQRHPPTSRTCKHLKQLLGEEFETMRARGSATAPRGTASAGGGSSRAVAKTTAPKVLLAMKWEREKDDPVGWWISEKLDGVRAFWDSSKKIFLSRLGYEYPAPSWFTAGFPDDVDLDGELFGGRGAFQFTVGIAKTQGSKHWEKLVYKVFDAPSLKTQKFEERMEHAKDVVTKASSKYIEWVEHTMCKSLEHLDEVFNEIEKLGGEGLMIREPGSKYAQGRSSSLLKIKRFHDGEAEVLAYEDGKGKYVGMVGALRCRMSSGKMFKVASGLSDQQRDKPPAIGSIIVYKCQELTNDGNPRFPVFVGIAADKTRPKDPVIANAMGQE